MAQAIRTARFRRPVADPRHITRSDLFLHPRQFRGRHHAATIFVVVLLAVFGFRMFPEKDVTVLSNGEAYQVSATFDAKAEGLAAASVALAPGDRVLYAEDGGHSSVAIQRARSVVAQVDGQQVAFRTRASTIGGALAEAGVELAPGDLVYLDGQLSNLRGPLFGVRYASRNPSGLPLALESLAGGRPVSEVQVSVVRARPYTVIVDNAVIETQSAADTVEGLLLDLGMTVREGDLVHPGLTERLTAGMSLRLEPARTVNVKLNGKDQSLYTQAETVEEVLRLLEVDPATAELLSQPLDAAVVNGMELTVGTTETIRQEVSEPIAPPTVYEQDATLAPGVVRILEGQPGVRVRTYSVTLKNGQETSRVEVGSAVTRAAVPTRNISGTRPNAPAKPVLSVPGLSVPYSRTLRVETTWYAPANAGRSPSDPNYGRTATGAMVDYNVCAVDPAVIPLYTRFYVPGYGFCTALDTGGAIKGNIVDLGFPDSYGDAGWGRQTLDIFILD